MVYPSAVCKRHPDRHKRRAGAGGYGNGTGRAGRKGEAILFVAPRERRMLYAIEKATRQKIEPLPAEARTWLLGVSSGA